MLLELVIRRLRARCPWLQNKVAGAANAAAWFEHRALKAPFVMVVPTGTTVFETDGSMKRPQWMTLGHGFQCVVVLNGYADERNQQAAISFEKMRDSLMAALAFWTPAKAFLPIRFEGIEVGDQTREWDEWYVNFRAPEEVAVCHDGMIGLTPEDFAALEAQGITEEQLDLEDLVARSGGRVGRHIKPPSVLYAPKTGNPPETREQGAVVFNLAAPKEEPCRQ